jgi:hypothetical protein
MSTVDLTAVRARLAEIAKLVEHVTSPPVVAAPPQPARTDGDAALASVPPGTPPPSKLAQAIAWLRGTLAHGPMWAKEVYARAATASIAPRTLERAKRVLHIHSAIDRRAVPKRWRWQLPARVGPE